MFSNNFTKDNCIHAIIEVLIVKQGGKGELLDKDGS